MTQSADAKITFLLKAMVGKDPQAAAAAWREMLSEYSPLLMAMARKTFMGYGAPPTPQDVEDAVADVWKNLLDHDRRLMRDALKKGHFLQTIQVLARNRSVDIMRRRHKTIVGLPDTLAQNPQQQDTPETPQEDTQAVLDAIVHLTPREQMLVRLFFLQGKKYREIADLTGIPQNSIGPTLARALARLRKIMGVQVQ